MSVRIAVIGATGAVGRVFLRLVEERRFPASSIRLCGSERSWGRKMPVNGHELTVEEATPQLVGEVDIAFIAASGDVSRCLAPPAAEQGCLVIDKSAAFRMDPDVPLVVPEVNASDIDGHGGIIASPNCSTTPLVMVLKRLNDVNPVQRVIVDTYQSVSGTGAAAMDELRTQSGQVLASEAPEPSAYPHRIAFNVLPHIEGFLDNGYTNEEMKMVHETRKILHLPDLPVSATCVRVPVMVSHSEAVHLEFAHPMGPSEVREILTDAPGLRVVDDPASNAYPMPIDAEGRDEVFVGRIRQDESHPRGVALWLSSDNLRKGAALNAIQIAEEVLSRDLLGASDKRITKHTAADSSHGQGDFDRGREYFRKNLDSLLVEYRGDFIAIVDGDVVDSDADFSNLAARVYGRYGYKEIFMPRVLKEPEGRAGRISQSYV